MSTLEEAERCVYQNSGFLQALNYFKIVNKIKKNKYNLKVLVFIITYEYLRTKHLINS